MLVRQHIPERSETLNDENKSLFTIQQIELCVALHSNVSF